MSDQNTKIVFVRRLPLSNTEKGAPTEVQDYFNQGKRNIGSFFVRDSVRPGTGLTLPEENLLMPLILDMDKNDRNFRASVTSWFHEISLKVTPHEGIKDGGLRLNISLEDNSKPVSADNLPHYPVDYVKYKFCLAHPLVGADYESSNGNILKQYYIHDPEAVQENTKNKHAESDKALTAYLQVKEDEEKVVQLLIMMNVPREEYQGKEVETLKRQAETRPSEFLKLLKNKQVANVALLRELLEAKYLVKAGERILYTETQSLFAVDLTEALGFLQDPKNSEQVLAMKNKVAEFRKLKSAE